VYLVDAYAWVEYFIGSKKGERAAKVIDDPALEIQTLESTLAEVRGWALREGRDFEALYSVIKRNSDIIHTPLEEWLEAAKIRFEIKKRVPGFGIIDALLIASKQAHGSKVLTGDPHFKGMADVMYLGDS
jgi:predicted nucleic acid-binding protein